MTIDYTRHVNPFPKAARTEAPGLRVIVCGSRDWRDGITIERTLRALPPNSTIVHGDCKGADKIADAIARRLGFNVEPHPADWVGNGRAAGPLRNREMARSGADLVIAFKDNPDWSLRTGGTENMVKMAEAADIAYRWVSSLTARHEAAR